MSRGWSGVGGQLARRVKELQVLDDAQLRCASMERPAVRRSRGLRIAAIKGPPTQGAGGRHPVGPSRRPVGGGTRPAPHPLAAPRRRTLPVSSRYLLAPALSVLANLYAWRESAKRFLYRHGVLSPAGLPSPVVSIGNLTNGGTGKTPFVEYLARSYLQTHRLPSLILQRGRGTVDETVMLRHLFEDLPIVVSESTERVSVAREVRAFVRAFAGAAGSSCQATRWVWVEGQGVLKQMRSSILVLNRTFAKRRDPPRPISPAASCPQSCIRSITRSLPPAVPAGQPQRAAGAAGRRAAAPAAGAGPRDCDGECAAGMGWGRWWRRWLWFVCWAPVGAQIAGALGVCWLPPERAARTAGPAGEQDGRAVVSCGGRVTMDVRPTNRAPLWACLLYWCCCCGPRGPTESASRSGGSRSAHSGHSAAAYELQQPHRCCTCLGPAGCSRWAMATYTHAARCWSGQRRRCGGRTRWCCTMLTWQVRAAGAAWRPSRWDRQIQRQGARSGDAVCIGMHALPGDAGMGIRAVPGSW